jgi:hypothetical protein
MLQLLDFVLGIMMQVVYFKVNLMQLFSDLELKLMRQDFDLELKLLKQDFLNFLFSMVRQYQLNRWNFSNFTLVSLKKGDLD